MKPGDTLLVACAPPGAMREPSARKWWENIMAEAKC